MWPDLTLRASNFHDGKSCTAAPGQGDAFSVALVSYIFRHSVILAETIATQPRGARPFLAAVCGVTWLQFQRKIG